MTRFATAAVLVSVLASRGDGQSVPISPPGPGAATPPTPLVIPITSAKPPSGFYKSGGVLVGADGYFPFDTGHYLLGGFDGLTRYSGTFVMVPPGYSSMPSPTSSAPVIAGDPAPVIAGHRGRLFHRR
jgi:hypothetical protein